MPIEGSTFGKIVSGLRSLRPQPPRAEEIEQPVLPPVEVQEGPAGSKRLIDPAEHAEIIAEAKLVARRYRALTGGPLGITGEVAEYEAVRLLGLEIADVRQDGYDAVRVSEDTKYKLQVKGRCFLDDSKRSQRVGGIKLKKEWDGVLLVLMNGDFEPLEIYKANRPEITEALTKPGSIARNVRGSLAVSQFKSIGWRVWPSTPDVPKPSPRPDPIRGHVKRSDEMLLVAYFLSRCGSGPKRTKPPAQLGVSSWDAVYPLFYDHLGEGRTYRAFRNSLQTTRDVFDHHVDNGRIGFRKPLGNSEQTMLDKWQGSDCADLWDEVRPYFNPSGRG